MSVANTPCNTLDSCNQIFQKMFYLFFCDILSWCWIRSSCVECARVGHYVNTLGSHSNSSPHPECFSFFFIFKQFDGWKGLIHCLPSTHAHTCTQTHWSDPPPTPPLFEVQHKAFILLSCYFIVFPHAAPCNTQRGAANTQGPSSHPLHTADSDDSRRVGRGGKKQNILFSF